MAVTAPTRRPTTAPARPAGRRRPRSAALAVLTAVGLTAVAYGTAGTVDWEGPGTPLRTVDSVGRVDGSTAVVAVLARGDRVSAFVADGAAARAEQFTGSLLGDRAVLRSAGGAELFVEVEGDGAAGIFTPAGAATGHPYRTLAATGPAGWYTPEGDGRTSAAAWVVLADGTRTGVAGAVPHRKTEP